MDQNENTPEEVENMLWEISVKDNSNLAKWKQLFAIETNFDETANLNETN